METSWMNVGFVEERVLLKATATVRATSSTPLASVAVTAQQTSMPMGFVMTWTTV